MSIPGSGSPLLLATTAAAAAADFQIDRSLRFSSADSAYLNKTFASAGNRKTWTWSGWIKKSEIISSGDRGIFTSDSSAGNEYNGIAFTSVNLLMLRFNDVGSIQVRSTAAYRDPGAWMHVVGVADTGNATASERLKLYVNGVLIDDFNSANYPSQNAEGSINSAVSHAIGRREEDQQFYFNGYLANIHFIDGQALAPTDFGQYDSDNNWNPKEYSGTYGTNGFYLKFADNSSNAALGTDSSGNSNTWTVNNLTADAPGLGTANAGFDVLTYTGTGSSQSIGGLAFQPDFVWIKRRDSTQNHILVDVLRGSNKEINSNTTSAEGTFNRNVTSFNSDGFSVLDGNPNANGGTFVAWCWKAGGSGVSNTDGTINSTVSANNTYGFSIINHQGTGAAGTFGHGLSSAPDFLIFKNRAATDNWFVWTRALNSTNTGGKLNSTDAFFTNGVQELNQTLPTDSVIHVGNNLASNGSGQDIITYAWTEVSGFSKFGSYVGNNSSNGPVITTGFKPRWVLIKGSDSGINDAWKIFDTARSSTGNPVNDFLSPNNSNAEVVNNTNQIDILDNGFQITSSPNTDSNLNGKTYIYAAFASKPDGSVIDSLIDTPTNYEADSGNNGGNYCIWNSAKNTNGAYSQGNLKFVGNSNWCHTPGTFLLSSGKWYFEGTYKGSQFGSSQGNIVTGIGFIRADAALGEGGNQEPVNNADYRSNTLAFYQNGYFTNLSTHSSVRTQIAEGDVVGVSINFDAGTYAFYVNNSSVASGSLSYTGPFLPWTHVYYNNSFYDCNFGQRPFAYTPPTGHLSLCTQNLPDPTIADGSDYFEAKLYTGNGTSQTISGLSFSPDWVWTKLRSAGFGHRVWDTVRGATKRLETHATSAEATESTALTAFTSDGFSLGSEANVNTTHLGGAFVAWCWDAGTSTATNTDGSITSSVRANQSAGFSIVTFTGTGSAATIGHGLNAEPYLLLTKCRESGFNWAVYHKSKGNTGRFMLNNNLAFATSSTFWNDTTPTNSVFSVGSFFASGNTFVAYCVAPVAGYQAVNSYTGNGSSDGVFVYTGFRPRFLLVRNASSGRNWIMIDTARSNFNVANDALYADLSNGEESNTDWVDILSNGFKVKTTNASYNTSGSEYIYWAVAEHPFKTARAR